MILVHAEAISSKFSIMPFNRKYLFGILAMIFLLAMSLQEVTFSQESPAEKPNVLRQASLEWMQVGMKQYQSEQFADAEKSFRRALVFKKYLTEAERLKINTFLTKARIDLSEGKQPEASAQPDDKSAEQNQPVKAEAKIKSSEPLAIKEQQQTEKEPKTINSRIEQKVQSVTTVEPDVPKIQLAAETSTDVIVVKDKSFKSNLLRLSAWLSLNRRNILLIGLPILAVLIIISKLQKMKIRPGRRVYTSYIPANSSFIGAKLAGGNEKKVPVKGSKKGHSASVAVAKPKRKSFSQTTDHWREKHFGNAPVAEKQSQASDKWPQQENKSGPGGTVAAELEKKQCGRCKQFKPHSDFYKNKSTKDGLARWCKECKKQYRKKRAAEKK